MYTHLYEWYRIIDARRDEDLFEKRGHIVDDITKLIMEASDWDLLISCVAGVAGGFEILGAEADFTQNAIACHQSHLHSFPPNLLDNSIELRVASGVVLEEIIAQGINQEDTVTEEYKVAASLLLSAFGFYTLPPEKYLADNLNRLISTTKKTVEDKARQLRHRQKLSLTDIQKLTGVPDQTAWASFTNKLQNTFQALERQVEADREEIEILWWLENGISTKLMQPFNNLSPISASIYAGLEVSELVILPPLNSTIAVVRKAVEKERRQQKSIAPKPLRQLVDVKDMDAWRLLAPTDETLREIVATYPSLLPLSWLGMRLKESSGSISWEQEFQNRTGILIDKLLSPADIAEQVFLERFAINTYLELW